MNSLLKTLSLSALLLAMSNSFAQVPAGAPAGTTGLCKDGSYYSGATKQGACRGHKGVKDWYGATTAAAAKPTPAAATAAPAATAPTSSKPAATAKSNFTPSATAAAGGGPGLVWANASSKVYHCSTDKWYGKTKQGQYMSEADAKSKGFKPDHGKACG